MPVLIVLTEHFIAATGLVSIEQRHAMALKIASMVPMKLGSYVAFLDQGIN